MSAPIALNRIAAAIVALSSALVAAPALSAGFALAENNGSGLGTAYAGGAAAAEDASTLWSNAAGMARLGSAQISASLHLIQPSMKFSNSASQAAAQQALGGEGGNAGSLAADPDLYFSMPINRQWSLGLGINSPFGLVSDYDGGWIGRFQGLKSDVKTINVNPAVSVKVADYVAIGAGANYQKMKGTFTSQVNYSAALLSAAAQNGIAPGSATFNAIAQATPGLESGAEVSGSDYGWGWNLGILVDFDKASRIGVHYRSAIKYSLSGSVEFTNPALPSLPSSLAPVVGALAAGVNSQVLYNSGITSEIKLPEIVNVSYFRTLNEQWDMMVDVQYTGWSSISQLTFIRTDGSPLQNTTMNFRDAWRVALGGNYRYSDQWMFRGGVAYDQSPVEDAFRTVRLPDADRTWLAFGAQYKMNPQWAFDVGAAYIWVRSGSIDNIGPSSLGLPPSAAQNGLVNGSYHNSVVILAGQLTYTF